MKATTLFLTAALAVTLATPKDEDDRRGRSRNDRADKVQKILEWDTMVGVPKALTGTANPIRGINGGGLPWIVGSAHGELKADGRLEIEITGLVFDPSDPDVVSRGLANRNTVPFFRAIVSCVNSTGGTTNLQTDQFPATLGTAESGGGNASIEAHLDLPQPCIAPVVFVTSPGGAWFAVTGR